MHPPPPPAPAPLTPPPPPPPPPAEPPPLRHPDPGAAPHHRRSPHRPIIEHQASPAHPPPPRAVEEQATAIAATVVDDEPAGIDEWRVAVPRVEERIVERGPAEERVVEERIEARAGGEAVAVIRPAVAIAEAQAPAVWRVVVAVAAVVVVRRRDGIVHRVVIEVPVGHHALHDVEQRLLLVVPVARAEHAVVPVIAAHELLELERRRRPGREHDARAIAVVDVERLAVAAAPYLERLAAAHEIVVAGIEREQHPHAPLSVAAEHDDIPIFVRADLHARLVAALEIVVLVERNFDGWVVTAQRVRRRVGRRSSEQ